MNLIRPAALVASFTLCATPALARIDQGTTPLLQSLPSYGITVALNPPGCSQSGFHGSYNTATKKLMVCYTGRPVAEDHDTVRHETFHAIQHCVATKRRSTSALLEPILTGAGLRSFVSNTLSDREIIDIKSHYPRNRWNTEMEATAAAKRYTAYQMKALLRQWC